MAITAKVVDGKLDYNYTDNSKKTPNGTNLGYDQFLQLLCAEMQYQDPLEPTANTDYVAQLATFSQLEATLSLEGTEANSFASSLVGKEVILSVENSNGTTSHVTGTVDYVMYEEGKPYLSVNNALYPLENLDTVASDGYYDAVSLANTFKDMVAVLPNADVITAQYKGAVQEVRDLYDGLTDYQKRFINEEVYKVFEAIEAKVKQLVELEEQQKPDASENEGADAEQAEADADAGQVTEAE